MSIITAEYLDSMTAEDLHCLFWEWYKECEGIRPRWMSQDDRKGMLSWCLREIDPDQIAMREIQFAEEARYFREWEEHREAEHAERVQEQGEIECLAAQLVAAYDTRFDGFDPRLGLRFGRRYH